MLTKEGNRVCRVLIFGFRRRRAVSSVIGGLIMLTLVLSALGTAILVSRQYDQYQQLNNQMSQYRNQQLSERLVINSPGLVQLTANSTWGSSCAGRSAAYNCFNLTVSNLGGVGIQVVRIYINSTGPLGKGCSYNPSATKPNPQPCILNPSSYIANYTFNQAQRFLNPGEVNHAIVIALPVAVVLPNPTPAMPQNTVMLVTQRGNVFAFQWPFQLQIYGQSQSAFSYGIMKVAYQPTSSTSGGYDSKNEPGVTGKSASGYCHTEPLQAYPAPSYDAEQLTGINGVGTYSGDSGVLTFVNPWITNAILTNAATTGYSTNPNATQIYFYVNVINTGTFAYYPVSGSIDLTWYSADHLDGLLIGVYYNGKFYPSSSTPSIAPQTYYYAIFHLNLVKLGNWNPSGSWSQGTWALPIMFWGAASLTDNYENGTYYSASVLVPGLWIRSGC
jgi:hypothetical protein